MKSTLNHDHSIRQNETYANIIRSLGFINIIIPFVITIMFFIFTAMFRINIAATNTVLTLCIFYGVWLLIYISMGIWVTLTISKNNWFIESLENLKFTYWLCSLIFLIIPIGFIGAIFWVIWGNKVMKITEDYRKFGDPKHKEENLKYFEELNKDIEEELEQEMNEQK